MGWTFAEQRSAPRSAHRDARHPWVMRESSPAIRPRCAELTGVSGDRALGCPGLVTWFRAVARRDRDHACTRTRGAREDLRPTSSPCVDNIRWEKAPPEVPTGEVERPPM
jgi:hypothetical protein